MTLPLVSKEETSAASVSEICAHVGRCITNPVGFMLSWLQAPAPKPQLAARMQHGLSIVSKEAIQFFPPDYQPKQSVREWLCALELDNCDDFADGEAIVDELEMELSRIEDRMGLEGVLRKAVLQLLRGIVGGRVIFC